ncbi:MFS transporter [Stappia stellulata]|uniref:MFS transporter n=1 Tax=Stappia stellulata TaxID=71235 RepID=UPI000686740C|nr:MFS transporter [Stappia stellulata]
MPLRFRVAALFAAYFFGLGLFLPFFPLVLAEAGLGAAEIGSLLALPLLIRLVANPLVSALTDRYLRPGQAIAMLSAVACAGFGGLFWTQGFWPTAILLAATSLAWGPLVPISDALAARVQRQGDGDYGRMRLWGSIAFVVANLAGGLLVAGWTSSVVLGGILAGLAVSAVIGWYLPVRRLRDEPAREQEPTAGAARGADALYAPAFLIVIAAVGLVQASHAAYYAFSALYWSRAGLGGTEVGLLWGLGVLTEILLFSMAGRIGAWIGSGGLLALGAAAAVVRWLVFPLALDPLAIIAMQLLHGLTFGATHLGGVAYVARMAPPQWAGTAQGVASTVVGVMSAVATALAGVLYASGAAPAFFAMAGLAGLGGVLLCISLLWGRPRG